MRRVLEKKVRSIAELSTIVKGLHTSGKKVAQCHGVFDLLHPGHIKHFQAAKIKADCLIVTLTPDEFVNKGPGRPIFNEHLRAETIAALECVDFVAINNSPTAVEAIKLIKPDYYAKGSEYAKKEDDLTGKIYDEEEAVKSVGGMLHFTDELSFSSTSLINAFLAPYPQEAQSFFASFRRMHNAEELIDCLKSAAKVKVLVIGDVIIDEYQYCVGMAKTQKDNIIASRYLNQEVFAGGVLAAANHIAGYCQEVTLLSVLGEKNDYKDFVLSHLKPNIKHKFFSCKDAHTVVKRRFVDPSFLSKLFEICYLEDADYLPETIEKRICAYLEKHLSNFDLVLVTDFGHGLVTSRIVDVLCQKAKFLAVNVQTNSSNIGFNLITKFPRADYICIDEPEIRLACSDRFSKVERLIFSVAKRLKCKNIIVTRGHNGSLVYSRQKGFTSIPVFSKEVLDRIGAGDAYFSITAPCVFKKAPLDMVGFVGNAVGAMKVLIVGNRSSVEPVALYKYISTLLK